LRKPRLATDAAFSWAGGKVFSKQCSVFSPNSEMEWPRKRAESAKQSFWQENGEGENLPAPIHPWLGSFVFSAPFRG